MSPLYLLVFERSKLERSPFWTGRSWQTHEPNGPWLPQLWRIINRIKNGINLRTTKIYKNHRINHLSTHQLVQDSMCQLYPHSWPHRCTEPLAETTPKAPSPRVKPTWALPSTEISPKIIKSWPEKNHNTEHCFDYHPGYIYIHTYIRIYTYIPYIYIYKWYILVKKKGWPTENRRCHHKNQRRKSFRLNRILSLRKKTYLCT